MAIQPDVYPRRKTIKNPGQAPGQKAIQDPGRGRGRVYKIRSICPGCPPLGPPLVSVGLVEAKLSGSDVVSYGYKKHGYVCCLNTLKSKEWF